MKILDALIEEERILILRLRYIKSLKKLYVSDTDNIPKDFMSSTDKALNAVKELGTANVKDVASAINKSYQRADNILRSLYKDGSLTVTKDGKKCIYRINPNTSDN